MDKLEKRLSNEGSSEQGKETESVQGSPVSQRNFSFDQYHAIIEGADSLQRLAVEKGRRKEEILSSLPHNNEVSLSRVYEFAAQLGINEKYINEYLELRFPSAEQQLQDVKKYNARCSVGVAEMERREKVEKCRSDITSLLDALKKTFPQETFKIKKKNILRRIMEEDPNRNEDEYVFYREDKKIVTTPFLKRKKLKKLKTNIASIAYRIPHHPIMSFDLYDPSFLRACNSELEEIKKRSSLFFTYHYRIKS